MKIATSHFLLIISALGMAAVSADEARWWPVQKLPQIVVRTVDSHTFPGPRLAYEMMVQSVAGLAAKAVSEGTGEEMVWVNVGKDSYEQWYRRFLAGHPPDHRRAAPFPRKAGRDRHSRGPDADLLADARRAPRETPAQERECPPRGENG